MLEQPRNQERFFAMRGLPAVPQISDGMKRLIWPAVWSIVWAVLVWLVAGSIYLR